MLIETSTPRAPGNRAVLRSGTFPGGSTSYSCMNFWYSMFGATIGTLNVWVEPQGNVSASVVWSLSGQQGNSWQQAVVPIPAQSNSYMVCVEIMNISVGMCVCGLCKVPAMWWYISETDQCWLRYVLFLDRSGRSNLLSYLVTVYWHGASESWHWPQGCRFSVIFHYFWPNPKNTCMLIFSIFSYFIFLFLNFLSLSVFIFCETARTHRFSVIFSKVQWHPCDPTMPGT